VEDQINQNDLIERFFDESQQKRINKYFQNLSNGQTGVVFHRGQLLELIRWVCLYCEGANETTFQSFDEKQSFAQAALIANELWHNRIYKHWNQEQKITLENSLIPLRLAIADSSPPVDIIRVFGKGNILFTDIFPRHFRDFETEFFRATNLSIDNYYTLLFAILALLESATQKRQYFSIDVATLKSALPHLHNEIEAFVQSESQTTHELKKSLSIDIKDLESPEIAFNLKPMRQKPLVKLSNGQMIIIDSGFLNDKASIGPLFHVLSLNSSRAQEIFSKFGYAFEEYASQILERMYPISTIGLVNRFQRNYVGVTPDKNRVEIADAILDDIGATVLFEMKAKWIRDDTLYSEDPNQFVNQIISQYSNHQPQLQLAKTITKLASDELKPENNHMPQERIFPIMICYDSLLNVPGFARIFADAFKLGLKPDLAPETGDMNKGKYHVTPLILITIDVLEDLETSVNNFRFTQLLSDYSADCANRMVSLKDYIRGSKYGRLIDRRGNVSTQSIELMTNAMKTLDPTWLEDEADIL
jgi:hypothetical protein